MKLVQRKGSYKQLLDEVFVISRLVRIILSALLLVPFSARSLTLVPRSLLLNHTITLAMQATQFPNGFCRNSLPKDCYF